MIGNTNATIIVGGVTPVEKEFHVQVVDYDGTRIVDERYDNGEIFTLPTPPTHSRLTFLNWVSNAPIVNNQITVTKDVLIGISYTTVSGQNEFDFELNEKTGKTITVNTTGTKEWGDGTSDTSTTHTYTDYGTYTVKTRDYVRSIFGNSSSVPNYSLKRIFMANDITFQSSISGLQNCQMLESISMSSPLSYIGDNCFQYCYSLKTLTFPTPATTIGDTFSVSSNALNSCTNLDTFISEKIPVAQSISNTRLKYISFPNVRFVSSTNLNKDLKKIILEPTSYTTFSQNSMSGNYFVEEIVLPENITTIPTYLCSNNVSLKKINLPNNLTSISNSAFSGCRSLEKLTMPSSLTNIDGFAFSGDYNLIEYDFSNVLAVPTLVNVSAFTNINPKCKMYVPDDLYDTWITSTNWVNFAYYIYKASEKTQS